MIFKAQDPNTMIAEAGRPLLEQLRDTSGAGAEIFQQRYIPLLYRLAQYVQDLPLEKTSHNEPRGAFRFGVVSAFLTMRMSAGVLFSTSFGGEMMGKLNPQFRFAAFAASLATVPLLIHHNMQIRIDDADWSYLTGEAFLSNKLQVASEKGCSILWKSPVKPPSAALGALLLSKFFDHGLWADFHPVVIEEMCQSINPAGLQPAGETQLSKIVRMGHEKARSLDEHQRAPGYVAPNSSSTISESILAAVNIPIQSAPISSQPTVSVSVKNESVIQVDTDAFPPEFLEWVKGVMKNSEKFDSLAFNPNGTITAKAAALTGFGVAASVLLEKFTKFDLVVEKTAKTVTFKSVVTPLFKEL
jgi:conjugal transfer pilus assembly protein TraI